jgi:hypothetical protein
MASESFHCYQYASNELTHQLQKMYRENSGQNATSRRHCQSRRHPSRHHPSHHRPSRLHHRRTLFHLYT